MSFTPSSRARGTGTASRYRRLPQLASLATASPQNNATTTTSRKPADTKMVNSAKFGTPLAPPPLVRAPPAVAVPAAVVVPAARVPGERAEHDQRQQHHEPERELRAPP